MPQFQQGYEIMQLCKYNALHHGNGTTEVEYKMKI